MQCQPVARHSLMQQCHHALRVVASSEADDKVIGISYQRRLTAKLRPHDSVEPHVEYVVQIDIAQQRGKYGPLCGAQFGRGKLRAVQDTYTQELARWVRIPARP